MSKLSIFSVANINDQLAATNGACFKVIAPRKGKDGKVKDANGTTYCENRIDMPGKLNSPPYFTWTAPVQQIDGKNVAVGITINRGLPDPKVPVEQDIRNSWPHTQTQVVINIANAGDFGKMCMTINQLFPKRIAELVEKKEIIVGKRNIHEFVDCTFPEKHPETPNQPRPAGAERIHLHTHPFEKHSDKYIYEFLRNQPKTLILDYEKPILDGTRVVDFQPATVTVDGVEQPLTKDNLYLFINRGARIMSMRGEFSSTPVSAHYVSAPIKISRFVIATGRGGGVEIDDEEVYVNDSILDAAPAAGAESVSSTFGTAVDKISLADAIGNAAAADM